MSSSKRILDVGCGNVRHGDICVDLYRNYILDEALKTIQYRKTGVETKIVLDVQADALNLPFRDRVFDEVYCGHLIEHVTNPYTLLRELIRVYKKKGVVTVKTPHRFSCHAKGKCHRNYFNRTWFTNTLKEFDYEMSTSLQHFYVFFVRPLEITVKIKVE